MKYARTELFANEVEKEGQDSAEGKNLFKDTVFI